jgi:hypothetical protein
MIFKLALGVAAAATVATAANATELLWTLQDVTFDDGGTASGSFEFNTATLAYTDINMTTTTGTALTGSTYTAFDIYSTPRDYGFGSNVAGETATGDPLLDINTTAPAGFSLPGTVALGNPNATFFAAEGTCYQDGCLNYVPVRDLTGSAVGVIVAVPEPATWAMLMLGLGGVGLALRRRRVAFAA